MKFCETIKTAETEGKEKHVPIIEPDTGKGAGKNIVRVLVGKEVPHPNTVEHHIAWVDLYGVKANDQVVHLGRATFGPSYTDPNIRFQVPPDEFKAYGALAYCNIHGLWQNYLELE